MSDQQMILILIIAFFVLGCNLSCNGLKESFTVCPTKCADQQPTCDLYTKIQRSNACCKNGQAIKCSRSGGPVTIAAPVGIAPVRRATVNNALSISSKCKIYEETINECTDKTIKTARKTNQCTDSELCTLRQKYCPDFNYSPEFCNFKIPVTIAAPVGIAARTDGLILPLENKTNTCLDNCFNTINGNPKRFANTAKQSYTDVGPRATEIIKVCPMCGGINAKNRLNNYLSSIN